jgi:NAD(P)H-dependent flavin oxidoreductase YrpB (nitropropane dioxygenase family)
MLHTPLCDLVGIEVPVVQAGMSIFTSAGLAAAVSNAGRTRQPRGLAALRRAATP